MLAELEKEDEETEKLLLRDDLDKDENMEEICDPEANGASLFSTEIDVHSALQNLSVQQPQLNDCDTDSTSQEAYKECSNFNQSNGLSNPKNTDIMGNDSPYSKVGSEVHAKGEETNDSQTRDEQPLGTPGDNGKNEEITTSVPVLGPGGYIINCNILLGNNSKSELIWSCCKL